MSDTRIRDATTLGVGDVVTVAVELQRSRFEGSGTYWWTRFAVVQAKSWDARYAQLTTLKMQVADSDFRMVDVTTDVVHQLPEEQWPQGVIAMRMKLIHTGYLRLDDEGEDDLT